MTLDFTGKGTNSQFQLIRSQKRLMLKPISVPGLVLHYLLLRGGYYDLDIFHTFSDNLQHIIHGLIQMTQTIS